MALSRRSLLIAALTASGAVGSAIAAGPVAAGSVARPGSGQEALSTEALIGRMIMVGFFGDEPDAPGTEAVRGWLASGKVGGVIFFEDNLASPNAALRLTKAFRQAAGPKRTPLLAVDQEGGAVSRLRPERGFEPLPSAREVAARDDIGEAFARYEDLARGLVRLGFNVNFGPVVDLELNSSSRIISGLGRSFGSDPAKVTSYARAFIAAHGKVGVMTAAKHFPGHGSTALDSHENLPDITAHWKPEELAPFNDLASDGLVPMIMVGHLVHREKTGDGVPASLSRKAVTDWLRGKLGFDGLVVTDDLHMEAIRGNFSFDEALVRAVEAGNDVLVFANREYVDPDLPERAAAAVRAAVQSGRISRERLLESHRRLDAAEGAQRLASRR
jgi:beta-N-acetylhexosaminidase